LARRHGPRPPRAGGGASIPLAATIALFVLRVWTGAFFCDAIYYKLVVVPPEGTPLGTTIENFVERDYRPMVEAAIADPPTVFGMPLRLYADFLEGVMLPNAEFFGPAILLGGVLLGITLVLGVAVRLSAACGFVMMLAFSMVKRLPILTLTSGNWPITLILLALCLLAAGRAWGLDAWLRGRLPRWIRWVS
jgi:hypothetical protein